MRAVGGCSGQLVGVLWFICGPLLYFNVFVAQGVTCATINDSGGACYKVLIGGLLDTSFHHRVGKRDLVGPENTCRSQLISLGVARQT